MKKWYEKMENNINLLTAYTKRQVIINNYVEEELINKDGFMIDFIKIENSNIEFIRNSQTVYSIDIKNLSSFTVMKEFSNYFSLSNGTNRTEIYFP